LIPFSGCVFTKGQGASSQSPTLTDGSFTHDLDVHIVLVGFQDFDEARLMQSLPGPMAPFVMLRRDITMDDSLEPLRYNVHYKIHRAPTSFATALFDYAKTVSVKEAPDAYLSSYDLRTEKRICTRTAGPVAGLNQLAQTTCKPIDRIDGAKIETWIDEHRADAGLRFGGAGYSFFVLDSYTQGLLPTDTYHQYTVADAAPNPMMKNLRAWGGNKDFVFLDVGAAPNSRDYRPWMNVTRDGVKDNQEIDEPIWAYKGVLDPFYVNLGRNIFDATRLLWARMPIYPIEYAERYVLPMYIITEPNGHYNPKSPLRGLSPGDIEKNTNVAMIQKAFQDLAPWAKVELRVKFIHLPDADRDLAAAVADAKSRFSENYMDYGILKKYFREHWGQYVPAEPGAVVYPTFAFLVDYPSTGLYAYSDADEFGHSWGVFYNAADLWLCGQTTRPVCFAEEYFQTPAAWWALWNGVLVHELGHSFGLTHPHDTSGLDGNGFTTYEVNWLWDSTASIMTYRHSLPSFDQFDRDLLYRSHTVNMAARILADPSSSASQRSELETALGEIQAGAYQNAFERARVAWGHEPLRYEEHLGAPAGAKITSVKFPITSCPEGGLPRPMPLNLPRPLPVYVDPFTPCAPAAKGVTFVDVPLDIPADATALRVEYKEMAAPTHHRWTVYPEILNKKEETLSSIYNNGYDVAVLTDLTKCKGGCFVRFWGVSGINTAYTLTSTMYR
jgi:hypothetical protein